jgi:hypothetical protein
VAQVHIVHQQVPKSASVPNGLFLSTGGMSSVTSCVGGGVYLLYLQACAFQTDTIITGTSQAPTMVTNKANP